MVKKKSGNEIELFGAAGVYGAVFAVGIDGFQSGLAWECAKG